MIHDISHEWPPFTFEFPVDPCTPAFATNRHCAIRIWCMYIVHVAEVLELVVSNWSMGWDGMGHRGLQNKWPGLPVAILLRVFGSIEHLNELEQRNIGIRRGLDCLASDPAYSIFSAFAAAPFSRDSYFVESRFLVESLDSDCASVTRLRFWWNQFPALSNLSLISDPSFVPPSFLSINAISLLPAEKFNLCSS